MNGHVVLIEPSGRGGIGHYTCQLAEGLSTVGAVVHLHSSGHWNLLPNPSYRVHRIYRQWGANPFRLISTILQERREGAAIIHWQSATHPRRLRMLQMAWLPKGNTRWVYTIHNVLPHDSQGEDVEKYRRLYSCSDGLIFHAESSRAHFVHRFAELADKPFAIIPFGHYGFLIPWEGINTPMVNRKPVILFFGAIRPYKGLHDLLEAFALVHKKIPEARLHIVGRNYEPWAPYAEAIQRLKIEDAVSVRLGYIPEAEVPTVLAQTRIVCLPYRDIDQSAVLFLAMAAGIPVVATECGGIAEVLRGSNVGRLVPGQNREALAAALAELLLDDERLTQMGLEARNRAETEFSWEQIAAKTVDFYAKLGADVTSL